jgi:hypothetical protein
MLAANGFDMAHMQVVHDRTLIGAPVVDCLAPAARRIRYTTRVTGRSIFDTLLRLFVGSKVEVTITNWGGPMTLVTGQFRRTKSYIVIPTQPTPDNETILEAIVLARRPLLAPLSMELRRWFTRGFMRDDVDRIGHMRYNPHTFVPGDATLLEFLHWVANLPQTPEAHPHRNGKSPAPCAKQDSILQEKRP